jgi:hypothetical protein
MNNKQTLSYIMSELKKRGLLDARYYKKNINATIDQQQMQRVRKKN